MSHLFNIKSVVLIALIILLFGLMVGQMIHVLFVATRKENRNPRGAVTYEALLLAHLLIACATVCSAYANHGALLFRMKMISFQMCIRDSRTSVRARVGDQQREVGI